MSKLVVTRVFNPAHQLANNLRGSRALDALTKYTVLGTVMEIASPEPDGRTMFSSNGVVFLDLATAHRNQDFVEEILARYKKVILDVHFPVLEPSQAWAADERGVIQEDATHQVIEYWSRPEVQEWVKGFLYRVPVITTPHRSTYRRIKGLNPNIILLPDVISEKTAMRFCKQFCKALSLVKEPDASTLERIGNRLRLSIGWRVLAHNLRRHIHEALRTEGI